jgi:uncharacterized lipoprotein YehR (DUF1307 family)
VPILLTKREITMIGTVREIIDSLSTYYDQDEYLLVNVWHTDDVIDNYKYVEVITKDEAKVILDIIEDRFDAVNGVNWETIEDATLTFLEEKNASK